LVEQEEPGGERGGAWGEREEPGGERGRRRE